MPRKLPGRCLGQKFAIFNGLFYAGCSEPPGGKKLLFMGCEFGQWREWETLTESLDWGVTAIAAARWAPPPVQPT